MSEDLRTSVETTESRRWIPIVVGVVILSLCCCASAVLAWFFGDEVLKALQPFFQLQ